MADIPSNPRFNSGRFTDIADSVDHSKDNTLALNNTSMKIFFKGLFVMSEPHGILHEEMRTLFAFMDDFEVDETLQYRPESVSEALYGTPDLWYMVLRGNNMFRPTELVVGTIKVVPPRFVGNFLRSVNKAREEIEVSRKTPTDVSDRTLTPIDVDL